MFNADEQQLRIVYTIIVIIFFLISLFLRSSKTLNTTAGVLLVMLLALLVGTRDITVGTDTPNYYYMYLSTAKISFHDWKELFFEFAKEPFFILIFLICNIWGSFNLALFLISFLTLLFGFIFSKRLGSKLNNGNALAIFCCYLISFYIFSQQINIIRAGLSATLVLNFYLSFFYKEKKSAIIYGLLSFGVHFTGIICIATALITTIVKLQKKSLLLIYLLTLAVSYLGVSILNIAAPIGIGIDKLNNYLEASNSIYNVGFRFSFALFNSVFFAFFWYLLNKKASSTYTSFFRLYVYLSCIFFLCFTIPYSDRVGGLSWNIIPFLTVLAFKSIYNNKKGSPYLASFILLLAINQTIGLI